MTPQAIQTNGAYFKSAVSQDGDGGVAKVPWHRTRNCQVIMVGLGILAAAGAVAAFMASSFVAAGILGAAGVVCLGIPPYQSLFNPESLTQRHIVPVPNVNHPIKTEAVGHSAELSFIASTLENTLNAFNTIPQPFNADLPPHAPAEISGWFHNLQAVPVPREKELNGGAGEDALIFQQLAQPKYADIGCHADFCAMPGQAYHASHISMRNGNYIAAQGATDETHGRFLQLLDMNSTAVSVALINQNEMNRPKNCRIGPTDVNKPVTIPTQRIGKKTETVTLPPVTVKLLGSVNVPGMNLRVDQLEINGKRHFRINEMGWTDHTAGNPARLAAITVIAEKLRQHPSVADRLNSPVVVNCNAGVGRTGTYIIASDDTRHYLQNGHDKLKIDQRILSARARRTGFVQGSGQYNNLITLQQNQATILEPLLTATSLKR